MAEVLMRQVVKGRNRVSATLDEDLVTALSAELAGEIQLYAKEGEEGTLSALPSALNKQRYSVGKKNGGYRSHSLTIHHVKATVDSVQVEALAKANLDCNGFVAERPEYCNLIYDYGKEA